jgi:NAD(P)-dependent dehydrogenase (short-subunit alcohol dehydrogenase family)
MSAASGTDGQRPAALVTGGRRGIGRACAVALAGKGFDVVLADISAEGVEETQAAIVAVGGRSAFVALDTADLAAHGPALAEAWAAFGGLECLVNNAGVSVANRGDLLDSDPADYDRVLAINLKGPFFLTIAVARRMLAAERWRGHRSIVNVASANSTIVSPERASYCISKAGLSMATRLFASRLGPHGITVNEVRPGIIRTDMTAVRSDRYDHLIAEGLTPIARWGTPEDVGRAVAILASGELAFTTGEALAIDGGLHIQRL